MSSTSKYQVLEILHQVPSTSTLLDPNPVNRLTMDMQTALSQDLPYRLRPEQTTVLEQLGQDRHVFVSLPTGYGKSECLTVLMDLLRQYESNSSITWSYLWGGLVRGKKNNLFKYTKLPKRWRTFCAFGIILLWYIYIYMRTLLPEAGISGRDK